MCPVYKMVFLNQNLEYFGEREIGALVAWVSSRSPFAVGRFVGLHGWTVGG